MKKYLILCLLLTCCITQFSCDDSGPFITINQIIIFGDDYSDGGAGANGAFVISNGALPPSLP